MATTVGEIAIACLLAIVVVQILYIRHLKGERLKEKIAYDNVLQHLNSGRAEIEYLFEIAEHELKAATEAKLKQRTE
jgi:hypothetical protein